MALHLKRLIVISLFLLTILQYNYAKKAKQGVITKNDFIVGDLKRGSVQLYAQTLNSTGVNGKLLSRDVIYQGMKNITRIRAMDLNVNGTGGYASIVQGGIGKKNVTLRLRSSSQGRGYNFYVDIFGK